MVPCCRANGVFAARTIVGSDAAARKGASAVSGNLNLGHALEDDADADREIGRESSAIVSPGARQHAGEPGRLLGLQRRGRHAEMNWPPPEAKR